MVSRELLKELRKKANSLDPVIRLGKNGINDNVVNEIDILLKKRELVKIKMLSAFVDQFDPKEVITDVSERTKSTVVLKTGYVFVLYRKK